MSTTIDQRVVEMQFDNRNFERNVSTTMSSLDKFENRLRMTGATKGLESIDAAAKKVNMAGLGTAVETVQAKFSALGVMGVTALANITNQAVNTGKRIASALTIDPIKTGFSEYETKMGAIQTIMSNTASKGTTMQDVTRVIGELNEYADKTIYNFAEMTRNIGTFTAAGVGLEESASAIQGIANLAAASGSTSQQASTAMYQLSQALAAGTVKLMDWNSVVNAGMGGEKFQEALKATAREHGVKVDKMIKKNGSFRESLQEGWITAEILNETLNKFTVDGATNYANSMIKAGKWTQEQADALIAEAQAMEDAATKVKTFTQLWDTLKESAQSGWSTTWEIVVGDFEEAKETLTEISDVIGGMIGDSADKRNDLLTGALSTGWKQLLSEGIDDAAGFQEMVTNVAKDHGVKLDEMINDETTFQDTLKEGWMTGDILTESVTKFTDKLSGMSEKELEAAGYTQETVDKMKSLCEQFKKGELSAEEFAKKMGRPSGRELLIESLWDAFKGVMTVVDPIKAAFREIFPAMQSEQLYNLIVRFKEFTSDLKLSDSASKNLKRTFEGLFATLDVVYRLTKAIFKPLFGQVDNLGGSILEVTAKFADWLVTLRNVVKLTDIFGKVVSLFTQTIIDPLKEAFREMFPAKESKAHVERLYTFIALFKHFASKLQFSEKIANNFKRTFKGMFAAISIALDLLGGALKLTWTIFKPLVGLAIVLAKAILSVTATIGDWLVSLSNAVKRSDAFGKAVKWIQNAINDAVDGIKNFAKSISTAFSTAVDKANARLEPLAAMGAFIKNMFSGLAKIIKKVAPYLYTVAAAIGNVIGSIVGKLFSAIQNADYDGLSDMVNGGIISAIGLMIAKFVKSASDVLKSGKSIADRIKDILDGVKDCLNAFTESIKVETIRKIAVAIAILAGSLLVLSLIPSDKLGSALFAISALFGELMVSMSVFSKIADGNGMDGLQKLTGAMIRLARALFVLAIALKIMSTMSWEEMGIALISMSVGMGVLAGAVRLLPEKNVTKSAKAIKKLSSAIVVLAIGIKIMSTMSWEEMGIGLISMVVGLGALVGAVRLLPKDTALRAAGMIGLATAMVILSGALKIMASMSWDEVTKSLITLSASLAILAGAMQLMKKSIPGAFAMLVVAPALVVLAAALKIMSTMSWEEIAKGLITLGGSLIIIAGAMQLMKGAVAGAAALVVTSAALAILAPVLKSLGNMSLAEIGKSLLALTGAFTVFGAAAAILKPVVPTMIKLAGAMLLLGVACAAIGAGVLMIGVGLTSIAGAGSAIALALVTIVTSIISLIPYLFEQIGVAIIKFCEAIAGGASAIFNAVKSVILVIVDAIVEAVPAIVEGFLVLVDSVLTSLAQHAPSIVSALFDFIISLIDGIAQRLPDLIQSSVNLIMSLLSGTIDALKSIDPQILVKGILAVGFVSTLMAALAASAALAPAAMAGVLAFGVVMAELAVVLAALGKLAQIEGLSELVGDSSPLLQNIGTAIGRFLGGLTGGFAQGMTSALPQIGKDLSAFMVNAMPFITGAKLIDPAMLNGVKSLVGVILALTAADILEGLTSWFTGGSSIVKFGKEIAAFAPYVRTYADAVAGIDASAVTASATAAKALAEMTSYIPNEGGVAAWFAGENSISKFGKEIVALGMGLKMYSLSIAGFNAEAVISSANAAKALAEMTATIPNEGGVAAWFAGENSISKFGTELVALGMGLRMYSFAITGFNAEAVIASANAAKALVDMTSNIPNEGGLVAWFTGENSVSKFSTDLVNLGNGLSSYSASIANFNAEAVIASANAAKAIADMTSHIPNEGGMLAWFTGENSISKFGTELVSLGMGLAMYSLAITGFNAEAVIASANAAQAIVDMTSTIPNEGGVAAWFTGETSISKFGADLVSLGMGLANFSAAVVNVNTESILAAAGAAKALAEMTATIPNEGGVAAWFAGENSISKFGTDIVSLGTGLKGFSDEIAGIVPENVTAAAGAAKALAEMASYIPNEGGLVAWFAGDNSVATFAGQLPTLGEGLKGFSDSVAGISTENITAAANSAKTLASMAETAPKNGGNLASFGSSLITFGANLNGYFDQVATIAPEAINASGKVVTAVRNAGSILKGVSFTQAANAIDELVQAINKMAKIKSSAADGFTSSIKKLAETNVKGMISTFKNAGKDLSSAGKDLIDKFVKGVDSKNSDITKSGKTSIEKFVNGIKKQESTAEKACKTIANGCADAISNRSSEFNSAGKDLGSGLVKGINAKKTSVYWAAYELGQKAVQGEKDGQKSNSPSKLTIQAGNWLGEGLIIGMRQMGSKVYGAGANLGETATGTISSTISRIAATIGSDIDAQPTIRPVLDLSDVRSGARALNGMLDMRSSVGVRANLGAISSMMNERSQNRGNDDVVAAIDKLNKRMDNMGNTSYNINGITYDDGSNVRTAVETLVRAARIERRM